MDQHGFFGTIDTDTGQFHGFPFVPEPTQGAALIWRLRRLQATQSIAPECTILVPDGFEFGIDQSGISIDDAWILHQLGTMAVFNTTSRTMAATAVSLLLNSAYFYIEAAARPDHCEISLHPLNATSTQDAHLRFMESVWRRSP